MKINQTILELIAVSGDLPCSLINRFEYSQRNMYRIIGRLIDAGLIKKYRKDKIASLRLTKKGAVYLQSSNIERFGEFEKIADKSDKEKRKRFRRKIISEFAIELEMFPYACDGVNLNGQRVLLAYTFNLELLKKFKSGIEYFETKGMVICFEFQKAVLEEYFGELADIVVIDMEI